MDLYWQLSSKGFIPYYECLYHAESLRAAVLIEHGNANIPSSSALVGMGLQNLDHFVSWNKNLMILI